MKNKKFTYLLVVLVLVIWGVIGFKVYDHLYGDTDKDEISNYNFSKVLSESGQNSVVTLNLNYADPFLKRNLALSTNNQTVKETTKSKGIGHRLTEQQFQQAPVYIEWPEVRYTGQISNDASGNRLYLLIINNRSYLLGQGDAANDILVRQAFADSVILEYKQSKKTILKTP